MAVVSAEQMGGFSPLLGTDVDLEGGRVHMGCITRLLQIMRSWTVSSFELLCFEDLTADSRLRQNGFRYGSRRFCGKPETVHGSCHMTTSDVYAQRRRPLSLLWRIDVLCSTCPSEAFSRVWYNSQQLSSSRLLARLVVQGAHGQRGG